MLPTRRAARLREAALNDSRRPTLGRNVGSFAASLCALLLLVGTFPAAAAERDAELTEQVLPLLERYCFDCHGDGAAEGDFAVDVYRTHAQLLEGRKAWLRMAQLLERGEMPPKKTDQPSAEERKFLIDWIRAAADDIDCVEPYPGRVTLRRLSRFEYRNTIRDLLGVDYQPSEDFPGDDVGYGFDNIGDVMSLPPILMEKYLAAAEEITSQAILTEGFGPPLNRTFAAEGELSGGSYSEGRGFYLTSSGEVSANVEVPRSGPYQLVIRAYGDQAGNEPAKMGLRLNGRELKVFEVPQTRREPGEFTHELRLEPGRQKIGFAFLNDYYRPDDPDPRNRDRNLGIMSLTVRGPLDAPAVELPAAHRSLFQEPLPRDRTLQRGEARAALGRMADRAFRRPARNEEIDRVMKLYDLARRDGDNHYAGVRLALQGILVSPHFLFRVESDPSAGEQVRELNQFELATRIAYFLWSSMPDDELFAAARDKRLRDPAELERQVLRMLADPRAAALVDNFAMQWLQLRNLSAMEPDRNLFPGWSDQLREDMFTETRLFLLGVVREDRSPFDLLDGEYTYLNERLAKHYGIEGVRGEEFRRVPLTGSPRGGLLTHGSVLTVTSNPTRTSPVKRGKWVLDNLLGDPPPPPAPDVPELEAQELTGTLRQRLEQHRVNPSCATCHKRMDPIGFALENFDAVGSWRTRDEGAEIDPSGELPGGETFAGPRELRKLLRDKRNEAFLNCLAEKLLVYALGRGLEFYDQCSVNDITASVKEEERFSRMVLAVVRSDPFQKRAGLKR